MWSLLLALLLQRSPSVSSDAITLNRDLRPAPALWQPQVRKYFKNPVQVWVHGNARHGRWWVNPDCFPPVPADLLAWTVKHIYPHRPVILCSCNAAGIDLEVKDVYYAKKIVWCKPGADVRFLFKAGFVDGTGCIEEFRAR